MWWILADEVIAKDPTWAYVVLVALIFFGKCLDEFRSYQTRKRDEKAAAMRIEALRQAELAATTAKETAVVLAQKTEDVAVRLEQKTEEVATKLEHKTDVQTATLNAKTDSIHALVNGAMGVVLEDKADIAKRLVAADGTTENKKIADTAIRVAEHHKALETPENPYGRDDASKGQ